MYIGKAKTWSLCRVLLALRSENSFLKRQEKKSLLIILTVVSSVVLLILALTLFILWKLKQGMEKKEELQEPLTLDGYTETYELENRGGKSHDLKFLRMFPLYLLQETFHWKINWDKVVSELSSVDLFLANLKPMEVYASFFYYLTKMWTKPLPEMYDADVVTEYSTLRPHVVALRLLEHSFSNISQGNTLLGMACWYADKTLYFAILNGIDTGVWNPTTDAFFPAKFDDTDMFGGCFKLQAPVSNALSSSRSESALKVAAVAKMNLGDDDDDAKLRGR
ncbi:hypothetical protein ACS0TY_023522 [Phlomoides rotata]